MGLSLAMQVNLTKKIVVSSTKFSWSSFCTLLISFRYQMNGQRLWLQQENNEEGGNAFQGLCMRINRSGRRPFIYFNFRLNIVVCDLHQADEFSP